MIRDFIPCKVDDGEIGLWDTIDRKFYGNAGTGTFVVGEEVVVEPIGPNYLLAGYFVGCRLRAMRGKKQPIGYLYGHVAKEGETPTHTINGVDYVGAVLPDIYKVYTPELQKEYPYAFLVHSDGAYTSLFVMSAQAHMVGSFTLCASSDLEYIGYRMPDGEWVDNGTVSTTNAGEVVNYKANTMIWANFNVLNDDGTIYLDASDHIPVYE